VVLAVVLIGTVGALADDDRGTASDKGSAMAQESAGSGTSSGSGTTGDEDDSTPTDQKPSTKPKPTKQPAPKPTFLVAAVIDGDTIRLGNGETVRLVGIDTPEDGQCGSIRAAENLTSLVLGRRVHLTVSDEDHDQYGRLLRYVDLGPVDAGLRQIKDGFAIARYDSRDGYGFHPREPLYIRADRAHANDACPEPPRFADTGNNNCAPGYDPCIAGFPPDLDCADVDGPIYVTGSDPHGLDADNDGVACEWS
jgi:endonuclease YncB( thermonuclease family)